MEQKSIFYFGFSRRTLIPIVLNITLHTASITFLSTIGRIFARTTP